MELGFQLELQVGWNAKAHNFPSSEGATLKKSSRSKWSFGGSIEGLVV